MVLTALPNVLFVIEEVMRRLLKKALPVMVASAFGLGLISVSTYSVPSYAQTAAKASAEIKLSKQAQELRSRLESITSFSANFYQDVSDPDGKQVNESKGTIALKRPSSFMMHTTEPDELALYTRKDGIYYYDAGLNQLSIFDLSNLTAGPFVLLLKSDAETFSKYQISQDGDRFTLIPLKPQEVQSITISFDPKKVKINGKDAYSLDSITIRMDDGNNNFYRFSNQQTSVSRNAFDYNVPKDAEIDDER